MFIIDIIIKASSNIMVVAALTQFFGSYLSRLLELRLHPVLILGVLAVF